MRLFVKGNKSRNPNIEFLRIIGMFFIISAHMIGYTDVWKAEISFNKIVGIAFASWSILAVDIFVVIFSYFMSLSKDSLWLKWKKRIKKAINVIFETFVASLIARCIFMKSISLDSVILAAKTPFSGEYWYITAYLSLVVLSPLLDEILKKRMLRIIILSILIGLDFIPAHCNAGCYHNDVLQFCMIYLLVGTVKCNSTLWTKFNKITLLIGAGIAQSFYWVMFWTDGIGGFIHLPYHELMRRYSIVMVICAISVFAYTIRKPIRSYAVVNMFADATLAVYIWHAGPAWEGYIAEKLHIVQLYETPFWSIFIIPILLLCYLILSFMWVIFISIFEEQLRFLCKLKCAKVETLLDHYGEEKKMNRNYEGWYMYVEIVAFLANIFCVLSSFDRILFGEGKKTLFEGVSGMPLNVLMCCVCFSIAISIVIGIIIRVYMSKTKACPCDMCGGGGIARYNSWTFLILAIVFLLMGKISNFQYFFIFIAGVIVTVICRRYDMKMDYSKENIVLKFKNIAPVLLFCIISLVICVPGELYLNNLNEFPIAPIPYILTLLIIAVVFWGIYVVGASFFLNMRQVKYFARVIFAVTLCGYVQRMFLNGHMRQMDGITSTAVYSTKSTINIIFWMLMLIVIVFIDIIMHRNIDKVYRVISIYIVLVEVVSVGYMVFSSKNLADVQKNWESDCTKLTWNGLCELSPNDNVVVFVLDWFDGQFMEKILSEEEEFLDPLEDFTYYTNTTSMYAYTGMSVPYLLSGTEWKYNMTDDEYAEYAFQDSNLLSDIVDAGVDARVFTDSKHLGYSIRNRLNNGEKIYPHVDIFNTLCIMTNCARYQMAPFVYKHCFYYTDNDLQQMVEDNSRTFYLPNDDKKVMDTFTESGLYLSNESKGAFRFYHLCGAHQEEKKDMIPMAKYSMEIVFWYIDQLKKLGLYDDATIIITADHGQNCLFDPSGQDDMEELNLEPTSNPILFVKEPNSDNESIVYSRAPVSHKEVVSEVMYAINSEQNRYGEILSDVGEDEERERIFIFNRGDMPYVKAVINGNVRRSGSWTIIEKIPLDKK